MHYIRFLKTPTLSRCSVGVRVNAKITITTDLGESFLCLDLPILVVLLDQIGNRTQVHPYQWKAGKRELEISLSVPSAGVLSGQRPRWSCRLLVQPRDADSRLDMLADALKLSIQSGRVGLVLSVLSEPLIVDAVVQRGRGERNWPENFDHVSGLTLEITPKRVARHLTMADGGELCIWEETGESIARHIWDAGLLLSAYLDLSNTSTENLGLTQPDFLKILLSKNKLNVLELGTGCGIVGISMAKRFPNSEVLITDIPEAEEIAIHNINTATEQSLPDESLAKIAYQNLNWENPLSEDLRKRNLDLILVADCTYNSDVVPDLVGTLADLVKHNPQVLILIAMKIRHDSEIVFFDLMKENDMIFLDKLVFPLPLLGQEEEAIELHFFKAVERAH